jgi:alpha-beta hydrolase superfamily lysophospholipase
MKEQTGHFEGVKGLQLFWQAWLPDGPPKAVLAIVHGVGEHIGRYGNMVAALVPSGYLLAGFDQRGHGRSEGQRGHINSWDEFREDIHTFLAIARQLAPGLPLFLYGHSQGSLEVLDYILHDPSGLAGAIISGTALEPLDAAPPHLVLVAKLLSGIAPTFSLKDNLDGSSVSRDPQVAKAYNEDPLVFWTRSVRWGTEGLKTIAFIKSHAGEINLPMLFLHGENDPLVSVAGAQHCYEQVRSTDKTIHTYPAGLHEPHNDLCREQVMSDIRTWLDRHIQ